MEKTEFKYDDYSFATFVLFVIYSSHNLFTQRTGLAEDYSAWEPASALVVSTCGALTMTFLSEAFNPRRVIQVNSVLLAITGVVAVSMLISLDAPPLHLILPYIIFLVHGLLGVVTALTMRDMRRQNIIKYWGFIRLVRIAGNCLFNSFNSFAALFIGLLTILAGFVVIAVWSFFQMTTPKEKSNETVEPEETKPILLYGLIIVPTLLGIANIVITNASSSFSLTNMVFPQIGLLGLIANIAVCYNANRLIDRFGFHGFLAMALACLAGHLPVSMLLPELGSIVGGLGLSLSYIATHVLVAKGTDSLPIMSLLQVSAQVVIFVFPLLFAIPQNVIAVMAWILCGLLVTGAMGLGLYESSRTERSVADVEMKSVRQ